MNLPFPDYLYEVQQRDSEPFGYNWCYSGEPLLPHGVEVLVAQWVKPMHWRGHAVDVFCIAETNKRRYVLKLDTGHAIAIESTMSAVDVARMCRLLHGGIVSVSS